MEFNFHIHYHETVKAFLQNNDFSKKSISAIKRNGALLVNGQPVTVRHKLLEGDSLCVQLPKEQPSGNLVPYDKALTVLYEDEYLLIVSKPTEQNCAPSRDHKHNSLVEQVLSYFQQHSLELTPHIVTRLDRNTSGIVIIAKHGYIHHLMSQTTIDKRYICVCHGKVKQQGMIEAPMHQWRNYMEQTWEIVSLIVSFKSTVEWGIPKNYQSNVGTGKLDYGEFMMERMKYNV